MRVAEGAEFPRTTRGNRRAHTVLVDASTYVRKVPPPSGQATGRKPGAGDRRLWNRNGTARPDR